MPRLFRKRHAPIGFWIGVAKSSATFFDRNVPLRITLACDRSDSPSPCAHKRVSVSQLRSSYLRARRLPEEGGRGQTMFMFDRKQLYVAAALIFVMEVVAVVARAAGY